MKPYKIVSGTHDNIVAFEDEVSAALEEGYELAGRLISKVIIDSGNSKICFYQPMVFEEMLDEIYDEEDDDDGALL